MKKENHQKKSSTLLEGLQFLPPLAVRLEPRDVTVGRKGSGSFLPDIGKREPQPLKKPQKTPRPSAPTKLPPLSVSGNRINAFSSQPATDPSLLNVVGRVVNKSQRGTSSRLQTTTTQQVHLTAGGRTLIEPLTVYHGLCADQKPEHRGEQKRLQRNKDAGGDVTGGIKPSKSFTQPTPPAGPKPQKLAVQRRRGATQKPLEKTGLTENEQNTELKQVVPGKARKAQNEVRCKDQEQERHENVGNCSRVASEQEVPVIRPRRKRRTRRTIAELCGTLGVNLFFFRTRMPRLRVSRSPRLAKVVEEDEVDREESL